MGQLYQQPTLHNTVYPVWFRNNASKNPSIACDTSKETDTFFKEVKEE
jgi:hypothetical protein